MRRSLLHVAVFSFVGHLLMLVPSIFLLQVFDRVLVSQSRETLAVLLLGAVIALGIALALDYLRGRLQGVLGNMVGDALAPAVAQLVIAARARAAEGVPNEALRDVGTLRALFSSHGLIALFDAPWLVVYVAVIWLCHPLLGLAALASAVVMLALALLNDRLTRSGIEMLQREAVHSNRYLEASLANAEVVHALGMAPGLIGRWRQLNGKVNELQRPLARMTVALTASARSLRQVVQIAMLSIGAYLVVTHEATPGVMIATTILLGRALAPVEQIVASWRVLAEARMAHARLVALLGTGANGSELMKLPEPQGAIAAQNLVYRPPTSDRLVLQNVSLSLAPGEALAIVGPSAAGKSTLVRMLAGIWKPSAGVVRLDGADLSRWPREALGPSIGYLPQDVELFQGTVAENIARLGVVDSEQVVRAAQRARAHEMILSLPEGYDTQVDVGGVQLSPGQRQRIALARALYGNPRLVILDEPNSNLDGAGERALADALAELREQSVTVIVVTHRNTLIQHVTHMLVLEAGRALHFGAAAQVLAAIERQKSGIPANVVPISRPVEIVRLEQTS